MSEEIIDYAECYQLLEIEPTDSLKEIKQAYRDIVFVWHPDRMTGNPRVQKKAEEKLKQINAAYDRLQSHLVIETPQLTKIIIYPQEINLNLGETYTFLAIGFDQNGNEVELEHVLWNISGGGEIYAEGSFFANYEQGTFTVTATSESCSDTATILITQPIDEVTENFEQDEEDYEDSQNEENVNSDDLNFKENFKDSEKNDFGKLNLDQPQLDIGLPWKRFMFWGLLTTVNFAGNLQDSDLTLASKTDGLLFILLLAWIIGMIRPKSVLKFGFPNTRVSVTQIYFYLPILVILLNDSTSTVWQDIGGWLFMLWFIGMINPKATFNLWLENRGDVTTLYFLLVLLLGIAWGIFKGISFLSFLWGGA